MIRRSGVRGGFTLPEALVAGALFLTLAGAFFFSWSGARREEELASMHLSLLESASLALHQLRIDLRQMAVPSVTGVEGFAFRTAPDGSALRLRQGTLSDADLAPFIYVEYGLEEAGGGLSRLYRARRTTDGSPLPGVGRAEDRKVFRGFSLESASFNYLPPRAGAARAEDHILHVSFKLISEDGARGGTGAFAQKTMLLTQVMRFLKPPHPRAFARTLAMPGLEQPPKDIVSDALGPQAPMPPFAD